MKSNKYYGVITVLKKNRIADRIAGYLHQKGLYKEIDRCPINDVGYFLSITGNTLLVKILERLTDVRFGDKTFQAIITMDENGRMIS